jgi:GMP synthase-like glutamine amidotransferase
VGPRTAEREPGARQAPTLVVIEHEPDAPPALLVAAARAAGVELRVVRAGEGEPVPASLGEAAGLVVLGGEMGIADVAAWPHLEVTMALIRTAAADQAPVLGICLGAQLAAHALGGRAYPGALGLEIGWVKIELTPAGRADPVLGALPEAAEVFHWHRDTFDLPPGAVLLARGDLYANQAFRIGSVVGVQFHPEVDAGTIAGWYALDKEGGASATYAEADAVGGAATRADRARRVLDAFCRSLQPSG